MILQQRPEVVTEVSIVETVVGGVVVEVLTVGEVVDSRYLSNKHGDLQQSIRVDVKTGHLTVDPDQPVLCLMLAKTSMCIKENTSIGRALGSGLVLLDMLQIVLLVSSLEI